MKSAVFIDLDGTLVKGETQLGLLMHLLREGLVPRVQAARLISRYALYAWGCTRDAEKIRREGYAMFAGAHVAPLQAAAAAYAQARAFPKLRRGALEFIRQQDRQGRSCVLVTAATELLATPLARSLGIPTVIATRLNTHDGRFTGTVVTPAPYGAGKRELVARHCEDHGIDPRLSHACTDHESDLPLLEFVGNPSVVSPTRRLARIALARGWPVKNLDH